MLSNQLEQNQCILKGEGWTPLIHAKRLGDSLGCPMTYIKNESANPTSSFKARGLCMAVSFLTIFFITLLIHTIDLSCL